MKLLPLNTAFSDESYYTLFDIWHFVWSDFDVRCLELNVLRQGVKFPGATERPETLELTRMI